MSGGSGLTPEQRELVDRVIQEALELPHDRRRGYVRRECESDSVACQEVLSLLDRLSRCSSTFLETPVNLPSITSDAIADTQLTVDDCNDPPRIGGYTILGKIGGGAMGTVWLALQQATTRQVAIKVIRLVVPGDRLDNFRHEATLLGRLQHDCIATIYDAGFTEVAKISHPYLVMELVDGRVLSRRSKDQAQLGYVEAMKTDLRGRLALFCRICDALQHAHQKLVIHRDLKPSNIMVTNDGTPKVLDFGVAKALDGDSSTAARRAEAGMLLGTLPYMSPEQTRGDPSLIDVRSDVYGLGVVLYELISGRLPYNLQNRSLHEVLSIIREQAPAGLAASGVCTPELEAVVLCALAKEPANRYASASELAADVRQILANEPISLWPDRFAYRLRKFARRNRTLVGIASIALLVLVASTIVVSVALLRERTERSKAQQVAQLQREMLGAIDPDVAEAHDTTLLRLVLDQASKRVEEELADHPEVAAAMHATIGDSYRSIGDFTEAEKHLDSALQIREVLLGRRHSLTLESTESLALLHADVGNLEDAERMFDRTVQGRVRTLGPGHPQTLVARGSLAAVYDQLGRSSEAEAILKEVISGLQGALGYDNAETLNAANTLAVLYHEQERYMDAREMLEQIVPRQRELLGPDNPSCLIAMNNLASVYQHLRQRGEANELFEQIEQADERVFGPNHIYTLTAMNNRGLLLYELGLWAPAEKALSECLRRARAGLGESHPHHTMTASNLADVFRATGRYDEAVSLYEKCFEQACLAEGECSNEAVKALSNLGLCRRDMGQLTEASSLLERALGANREKYGDRHVLTCLARSNLALVRHDQRRYDEAESLFREAIDEVRILVGTTKPVTGVILVAYGRSLARQGRHMEADGVLGDGCTILCKTLGSKHFRTRQAVDVWMGLPQYQ